MSASATIQEFQALQTRLETLRFDTHQFMVQTTEQLMQLARSLLPGELVVQSNLDAVGRLIASVRNAQANLDELAPAPASEEEAQAAAEAEASEAQAVPVVEEAEMEAATAPEPYGAPPAHPPSVA